MRFGITFVAAPLLAIAALSCASCTARRGTERVPRAITVAQSGGADLIGSDSAVLQKAVNRLRPGDTLAIGPGTYDMENSLFVPSNVTVRGVPGKTILRKGKGIESSLIDDGDYGDTFLAVSEPGKFQPGMGISVIDDKLNSGWDITVTSVATVKAPYLIINPMTVRDYEHKNAHARVRNTFPILCMIDAANVTLSGLTVDGNKAENAYIDGCRGGAVYMYRVRNVTVRNCTARNYNGDGISFQISDGVHVVNSESFGQTGYGVHPGTGSVNSVVQGCRIHDNGQIGIFLCWRVRHGRFENNVIEANGQYGISIGHKDTDNNFANNTISGNGLTGVYFRKETRENSGNRNVFRNNTVLDNGNNREGYGFYIPPDTGDLVIENNQIGDTRSTGLSKRCGIYAAAGAGTITAKDNTATGSEAADYRPVNVVRASAGR